jgi:hypothetical protein
VLNADDPEVAATVVPRAGASSPSPSRSPDGCFLDGDTVVEAGPGRRARALFARADLPLAGLHNLENAMAAALLARALGAPRETIARRAARLSRTAAPHGESRGAGGVAWYDDSKGTNIGASTRAVAGFADHSVHWILGGRAKGADPRDLRDAGAAQGGARLPHWRVGRVVSRRARRSRRRGDGGHPRSRRRGGGRRRPAVKPSCCRPPAPASTSSATSTIAAISSSAGARAPGMEEAG